MTRCQLRRSVTVLYGGFYESSSWWGGTKYVIVSVGGVCK